MARQLLSEEEKKLRAKARFAKYLAANREKNKAKGDKYRAANPEKIKARHNKYRADNREKTKASAAKSRLDLPDGYLSHLMRIPVATATPELIQLKRDQIILTRAIREFKNATK